MGKIDTPTSFGTGLYSKLSKKEGNLFFSSYSILTALGMTAAGAKGETRKVLCSLLGCPQDGTDAHFRKLIEEVNKPGDKPYNLITANALWGDQSYVFNNDYIASIKESYGGLLNTVDFVNKPQQAVSTINAWVSEVTKGLIPEVIAIDFVNPDTRLVLTNAIYFKGNWQVAFDKTRTAPEDFFGTKATKKAPLMRRRGAEQRYYQGESFSAVDLPYKGDDLSMLVVLPNAKDGLPSLERLWTDDIYQQVRRGLSEEEVNLYMPRFKAEGRFKLKPVLSEMGAALAFSDNADFTGIGPERLKISEVIHKAFVDVDEEGTTAAAATAVGMMRCAAAVGRRLEFRADHPFLYFIRNANTGTILFQGRLSEV